MRRSYIVPTLVMLLACACLATPQISDSATAATSNQSCRPDQYTSKFNNVTAQRSATVVTARVQTYPGPTSIRKATKVATKWQVNVRAGLGANFSEEIGGGISLGSVVHASDATKFGLSLKVQAGWNRQKSHFVTTDMTYKIPAAHSVVWYAGFQTVHGTFRYSYCSTPYGFGFGSVMWATAKWRSFSTVRDAGGQRCDRRAETPVARAAKAEFCL